MKRRRGGDVPILKLWGGVRSRWNTRSEGDPHKSGPGFPDLSNFWVVSVKILASFSCVIIHDTFYLASERKGLGFFHALAIVSLAPVRIKWISF